jgi:hypothetical protein
MTINLKVPWVGIASLKSAQKIERKSVIVKLKFWLLGLAFRVSKNPIFWAFLRTVARFYSVRKYCSQYHQSRTNHAVGCATSKLVHTDE